MIAEVLAAVLVILGSVFVLLGSVGLVRLPDLFARLHGPTKATTLGVGAIVLASVFATYAAGGGISLKALAIPLFLFITAPVSAHLIGKAALKAEADAKRPSGAD